jgi:hypothetical protein
VREATIRKDPPPSEDRAQAASSERAKTAGSPILPACVFALFLAGWNDGTTGPSDSEDPALLQCSAPYASSLRSLHSYPVG